MKAIALLLLATVAASANCTVGAFTYCREITLSQATPSDYVVIVATDYPSPDSDASSFITSIASAAAKVQADGDDIQFVDPSTGLPFVQGEIAYANATGLGIWAFYTPSEITSFWVRYGKASATDISDFSSTTGVFQDYRCYIINGDNTDLSGNSCTPTEVGASFVTTNAGLVGDTWTLVSTTPHYLVAQGMDALTDTSYSVSFVVQSTISGNSNTGQNLMTWPTTGSPVLIYWSQGTSTNKTRLFGPEAVAWANPATDAAINTWYVITCAYADTTIASCWRDGVLINSITPTTAPATRNDDIFIGIHNGLTLRPFDGKINIFGYRSDQGAASTQWQEMDTAILKDPNTTFTWGDEVTTAAYVQLGLFRRTVTRYTPVPTVPTGDPEVSVICNGATVDLGSGSCPAYDWDQRYLLGSGR